MTASAPLAPKPLWRRLLWPAVLSAMALVVLLSLGTWQVNRMHWKEALIADVTDRLKADPVPLPNVDEWASLDPELYQYRRVTLTGRYLHDQEQRAYMVVSAPLGGSYGGQGVWIMTPLELFNDGKASGKSVWINRGFVPNALADSDIISGFEEPVNVSGLMRRPEEAGFATPGDNGFDGTLWFVRNPAALQLQATGSPGQAAPFFVDLDADETVLLPQSGETRVQFENRHFGYVLTWYGIALTLLGVFIAFAIREAKKGAALQRS